MKAMVCLVLLVCSAHLYAVTPEFVGPNHFFASGLATDELGNIYFRSSEMGTTLTIWRGTPSSWEVLLRKRGTLGDYIIANSAEHYYITAGTRSVVRTLNGGQTYTTLTQTTATHLMLCRNRLLRAIGTAHVYLSDDHGVTWRGIRVTSDTYATASLVAEGMTAIATVAKRDSSGIAYQLLSNDSGQSWYPVEDASKRVALVNSDVFYALSGISTPYYSADYGKTWNICFGLNYGMAYIADAGRNVIISNMNEAFIAQKPGAQFVNLGLPLKPQYTLQVVGGYLYIGYVDGLHRIPLPNSAGDWGGYR